MIRRVLLLAAIVVALVVAGCGGSPTPHSRLSAEVPAGTTIHQLTGADPRTRTYVVHRPAVAPGPGGYPLVVMLHGGFGTAELAEKAYGWDELAERAGFIVVYPDGVDRTWNAGSCCGRSAKTGVDDVGFIAAVVAELSRQVAIDPQRRYAAGMSNGAMMAYRLARQTTLFAAIAPVSGTQLATCDHAQPTSVLHLHGSTDPRVRLDGKPGDGASAVTGPPISTVLDGWRARDRCGAFTTTLDGPLTTAKADCPSGREVRWVVIAGLGHEWPTPSASGSSLDATTAIWDFFAAHPKSPG